ncbi:MAG: response regulator, partial [Solirubrobacterales bacterium]
AQNATVRVSVAKLDRLVAAVRELETARVGVEHATGVITEEAEAADLAAREHDARAGAIREVTQGPLSRLQRAARELSDDVNQARTVPLSLAFDPLPRAVRDLARDLGRDVELTVSGGEIDVDRAVLEVIRPALVHLVRNAIDHGIEPPAMRAAAGKPETGTLSVSARSAGSQLSIEIADDGAGIDGDAVLGKAIEAGLVDPAEAAQMEYGEAIRFVLRPAFSTREAVSEISGRGVGLDAVFEGLTALQGSVDIASVPGAGTTVTLKAPLAIAATECIIAELGGQPLGIVLSDADRILRLEEGGAEDVQVASRRVPLAGEATMASLAPDGHGEPAFAVVVAHENHRIALPVESVRAVLRLNTMPLPAPLPPVEMVRSAAILPDGSVLRIVDARSLVAELPPPPRILVVDDSGTQLERARRLLVAAGYLVETAPDGAAALARLHEGGIDALLTDFEMPEMDGFELVRSVRADPSLAGLPVIVWSASGGTELFGMAREAGSDAFFMKGPEANEEVPGALQRLISPPPAP